MQECDETQESNAKMAADEIEERRCLSEVHIRRTNVRMGRLTNVNILPCVWSENGHERQIFLNARYTPNMHQNLWLVTLWGPHVNDLMKISTDMPGLKYHIRGFCEDTTPPTLRYYLCRFIADFECNFGFPEKITMTALDFIRSLYKDLEIRQIWTHTFKRTGKIQNKLWLLDTKDSNNN